MEAGEGLTTGGMGSRRGGGVARWSSGGGPLVLCEGSAVRVGRHMQWWSRVVQGAHVLGMCRARKRVNGTGGGVGVCGRNGGKSLAGRKSFGGFRRGEVDCLRQG